MRIRNSPRGIGCLGAGLCMNSDAMAPFPRFDYHGPVPSDKVEMTGE
jgi:hypothetical protein